MAITGLPFEDIRELISGLPAINGEMGEHAETRNQVIRGQFGWDAKAGQLMQWLAGWSGKSPAIIRPMVALFAGTHGVADHLGANSGEDTLVSVTRMAAGGAPVNQACAACDIGLKVFDLALQFPAGDISQTEGMDEKGSAATIGFGMEAIAGGVDLLGLGAFGKGGRIASMAILSLLPEAAGVVSDGSNEMSGLVRQAVELHGGAAGDPLEVLRRLGGREHSALAGAILAARTNHVPVVLDGVAGVAVACLLKSLREDAVDHCVLAGGGVCETAVPALEWLGLPVVLDGYLLSEDGSAAAQAIGLIKSQAAIHANSVLEV